MRNATKLCAAIAMVAIGYASVPASPASQGSIRGVVIDSVGNPLVGVAVMVLAESEEAKADKVVKRASTDDAGKFVASGITPGRYRVKAEADGFNPVELAADVRPNKVTVFDSILLRRVTTLADETALNADPKYASRRARGTIFQLDQTKSAPTEAADTTAVALTDRTSGLHGAVQTFAQSTPGSNETGTSFTGANFAVSELIAGKATLVVSGQAGYGTGAPQSLRALTTAHLGNRHRVAVALGYGRFTFSRHAAIPRLGQISFSATDTWQVSGPVLIVYGLEVARFSEGSTGTSVLPRFGVAVDVGTRTRLFANLTPGSSTDSESRINLESGEVEFAEPRPVAISSIPGGSRQAVLDQSYRLEFGGEQILSDKSSIEMMAFVDTVSGHGVGLLAIPHEGSIDIGLRNEAQSGRTRGVRVVYHRRVNRVIDGSFGYAFGEGQQLDRRGISEPAHLFSNSLFHVFSAKVDANFVTTGTRVSTVLRLAPGQAIFAIDPFQGQLSTFDPNVSVSLTQDLPNFSLIPGQWAAVLDLRNLLDQQSSVSDDRQELVASRFHRLVRVGVSLRF